MNFCNQKLALSQPKLCLLTSWARFIFPNLEIKAKSLEVIKGKVVRAVFQAQ